MEDEYKKQNMSDHDLLITMHEQIRGIKSDIKEIKDGTTLKIEDHELRLRIIERFKDNWTGRNAILAVVVMFVIGWLGSYLSKIL